MNAVEELQRGHGRHRHRRQQLGAPQRAGRRGADLAPSQLYRGELVERGALDQRVVDAAGQRESALDEVDGGRIGARRR